jgi:hypothetical protein
VFKKAVVLTRPPLRAKTRMSPNKAAERRTASRISDDTFGARRRDGEPAVSCGEAYVELYVEGLNDARTPLADFFNTLLTLLCGVSYKWAEELPQFFAAAGWAGHYPSFMLLQCHHDQRLLPAIEARIVVHRHGELLLTISQKS